MFRRVFGLSFIETCILIDGFRVFLLLLRKYQYLIGKFESR
jgi:hypothetical protein